MGAVTSFSRTSAESRPSCITLRGSQARLPNLRPQVVKPFILLDFILRSTIVAVENWLLVVITPVLALVAGFVGWELRERTNRRRVQHRVVEALLSELDETGRTT